MANYLGDPLHLGLYRKPIPRASISIVPSSITAVADQTILTVITVHNNRAGASVILTQSGDFVDADFNDTLINTVAAAAAATTGVAFDVGTRRLTFSGAFGSAFGGAFQFNRVLTSTPIVGSFYNLTLSAPSGGMVLGGATAQLSINAEPDEEPPEPLNLLAGVNLSSGEFGVTQNYTYGVAYLFPSNEDVLYFYTRGMRNFRVPFRWSRTQPILGGLSAWAAWATTTIYAKDTIVQTDASTAYKCLIAHTSGVLADDIVAGKWTPWVVDTLAVVDTTELDRLAAYITSLPGAVFIPDCHEYIGRRAREDVPSVKLGDPSVPTGSLGEFWVKLAVDERNGISWTDYGDQCRIGLFNEPQSFQKDINGFAISAADSWSAEEWKLEAFADIAIMRVGGVTQTIHVPGCSWTGAWKWIEAGNGDAWAWANLTAPQQALLDNTVFEMHQYLDIDASGSHPDAEVGVGATRLIVATEWARANGYIQGNLVGKPGGIYLGEIGFADNPGMITEFQAAIGYALTNNDVWIGFSGWAGGPFWNQSYMYLLEPAGGYSNPVDKPQMFTYMDIFLPITPPNLPPTDITLSNSVLSSTGVTGTKIGDLSAPDPNPGDIVRFTLSDDAGGRLQVFGHEIRYGSTPLTLGETYQGTVVATDRGGNTLSKTFSFPVLAAPNVGLSRVSASVVNEGQNIVLRTTVSAIVPGSHWDFWVSGNVPAQMVGNWDSVVRPAFEAKGYQVTNIGGNPNKKQITMLIGSIAGTIDVTWPTLADAQTEGANFQANFFMDNAAGVTLSPAVSTSFIADTSLTPGWSISVGAGSVFPGGTITTQIKLFNPAIGAKITVTPGGVAVDADFTTSFDAAIAIGVALETGLTYNSGTNQLEVTGAWDGVLTFDRVVAVDQDPDEVYTQTLSGPVASVIATAVASVLIRQQQGTTTVNTISYYTGDTTNTTPGTHLNSVRYRNSDDSMKDIAANALCIGDRGLLFAPPLTNFIPNPRGEGGTLGTITLPTDWTNGSVKWTFVSRGVENGIPYCRFTRSAASASNSVFQFTSTTQVPSLQGGNFAQQCGVRVVSGTIGDVNSEIRTLTNTGAVLAKNTGFNMMPGPNVVWYDVAVAVAAGAVANLQPGVNITSNGADCTIDLFTPCLFQVPLIAGPGVTGTIQGDLRYYRVPLPPAGILGAASNVAITADLNFVPPPEGTIILDFWSECRWGGECLLSLYSDDDNYIEIRQHIFGALELWFVVNGSPVVQLVDPITQTSAGYITTGKRHKLALVYGLFDARLVLDGRLLCQAGPTVIPFVDKIKLGRDRNDANHAHMVVSRLIYRNDQRDTDDLLVDTLKPGKLGSPGINLAGGEFGSVYPGQNRVNYFFSDAIQNDKTGGAVYWRDKGIAHQRVPFKWQRVQPVLLGPLDTTTDVKQGLGNIGYLGLMDRQINNMYSLGGLTALVDMHNFGTYSINDPRPEYASTQLASTQIGTAPVTVAAWIDCWERLTTHYMGNPAVKAFDLMNESYRGLANTQQLIDAIAAIDPTRVIYVEGAFAAGLSRWPGSSDDTRFLTHPVDTIGKIVFSTHTYYDKNISGVYAGSYLGELGTPDRLLGRLQPFDNWRIAHGLKNRKAGINESGAPTSNLDWVLTLTNAIKLAHEHDMEYTVWAAGEAFGGASQNMEPIGPAGSKVDRPGIIALSYNRYQTPGVVIQDFVLSASTVVSGTAAGTLVGNVTASDGGTITGLTLIDTQGNRFALVSLALKTGATATNFATAQQHVIVLNGLINGVTRTQSLTITVTQVVTTPAVFVLAQGDNIVSGSPPGTLVSPVTSDNGAPITSLALSVNAGNRFAISGLNLVAGAVATDYSVATSHSITMTGLIGGVSTTTVFPSVDVTPAPPSREFTLSANSLPSASVQGTLVGLVQSPDGIVSNLSLADSAGNRFQIGATNRLEAGSVATNIGSATSHSIVIDGLIGGVSSSTPFVVSVTPAAGPTFVFLDPAEIPSGTGPGVLISRVESSNGNGLLNTFTLTDTAGNRFAVGTITVTPRLYGIYTGSVATNIATATSHQITMRANHGPTGPLVTQVATITVKPAVAVEIYNLSASSVTSGAAPGTFVGTFSGSAGGALTGLSLTQTAGSRFALSGNNLVTGATATDFATASSHLITLTGSIGGTARTQDFTITVNSTGFGLVNLGVIRANGKTNGAGARNVWDLFLSGMKIWAGTGSSSDIGTDNNAGTGDLRYINVLNDTFVTSGYLAAAIAEEQAERFKFIDGAVTWPGIDPEGGGPVRYHREESGTWVGHTIAANRNPQRLHTLDVYKFNNEWFASFGTDNLTNGYWDIFAKTTDPTGVTGWAVTQNSSLKIAARGGTFFEQSGSLYCGVYFAAQSQAIVGALAGPDGFSPACVKWDGTSFVITGSISRSALFPGFPATSFPQSHMQVQRPINIGTTLLYVGGPDTGDAQWIGMPQNLFVATANFATITRVTGLLATEVAWDLIVRGSTAYVLTSTLKSSNPQVFTIRVRSSVAPFSTWTEIVNFDQPTFARSFEEYNGAFYFGLGTDRGISGEGPGEPPSYTDVVKAESGNILKWTGSVVQPPPADVTVALTLGNTHQTMQGFGSSTRVLDDSHVFNLFDPATGRARVVLTQAQKNDIYDKLYVDLKLTRVRPIPEAFIEPVNDNADPLVTDLTKFGFGWKLCDEHIVWAQAAKARGATTIWISPVVPETWMDATVDKLEYVENAMAYLNRFRSAGVELDYWAICNEPSYNRYPRTGAYYRDAMKLLGAAITSAGMTTQLVAADDIRATNTTAVATTILADATAKSYTKAIATHLYDEGVSNMAGLKTLAATHGKPVWMSEFSLSGMGSAGLPATGFEWAKLMHSLIATYDCTAVDYMWGAFGQWTGGADSLIMLNHLTSSPYTYQGYTLQKQYYMMGQYTRFVPVGAIRVDAVSDDATVLVSAFKSGAAITIVAINNSGQSPTVVFTGLTGKTSVSVVRTSTTEDWAVRTPIAVSGGAFTAVLTPNSVTTFTTP